MERHLLIPGARSVCLREVQKTLKESAKKLIEDKLATLGLGERDGFRVFRDAIETPHDGIISFSGLRDHNAESIKSLEGYDTAWVEEARTLSARSIGLLRPTIRAEGSELWFSWNPFTKRDPVDLMLRGPAKPRNAVVVRSNWSDNPWFPRVLEEERQQCLRENPDGYAHIWEGDYATVVEGAYYTEQLRAARATDRIGFVPRDPLLKVYAVADIAGTGDRADAFVFWIVQFIGQEIRLIDYYEVVGQPFAAHVAWLRERGFQPHETTVVLPHDGATHDKVFAVTPESFMRTAGYGVHVIPNQGRGAAMQRIGALRQVFPRLRFNQATTEAGIEALAFYHSKIDEERKIDLGPDHDWSSHGADAAGLIAVYALQNPPGLRRQHDSGGPGGVNVRRSALVS